MLVEKIYLKMYRNFIFCILFNSFFPKSLIITSDNEKDFDWITIHTIGNLGQVELSQQF